LLNIQGVAQGESQKRPRAESSIGLPLHGGGEPVAGRGGGVHQGASQGQTHFALHPRVRGKQG
jgi:hypothetical protein